MYISIADHASNRCHLLNNQQPLCDIEGALEIPTDGVDALHCKRGVGAEILMSPIPILTLILQFLLHLLPERSTSLVSRKR